MDYWTRGPSIGRGSTATVSLATSLSGHIFAVKSTANLSYSHFLQKEHEILSKLNSPRIVKYLDYNITLENNNNNNPTYNLCMEFVNGGTLFDVIRRHGGRLNERMIRLYTLHVLEGLDYLHKNGVIHCDVKSKNVLVGQDGAKIADFGCAKVVDIMESNERCKMFSGTPLFMAPEVARREQQGFKADIWAVGCMVIEMATGKSPWYDSENPLYRIGFSEDVPEFPSWMSGEGKDFLSKCLKRDAMERWTAEELLKHPFAGEVMETNVVDDFLIIMNSPNAVLCHGFWDGLEVSGCDKDDVVCEGFSSCSPSQRIRMLSGGARSLSFDGIDWNCDEDWITIRGNNDIDETEHFLDISSARASSNVKVLNSDSISVSISDEYRGLEYSVEDVDATIISETKLFTVDGSVKDKNVSYYLPVDNVNSCVGHLLLIF